MKKTFASQVAGLLLPCALTSITYSQSSSIIKLQSSTEKILPSARSVSVESTSGLALRSEINAKAVRNFVHDYKDVANAKWVKLPQGFSAVYFTADEIITRLVYDARGQCEYKIRYYFENKLPPEVRHLVKSTYYDFSIYHIIEPTLNGITSYLVKMEGPTTWKTVKVVDGEMEVFEEYLKLK